MQNREYTTLVCICLVGLFSSVEAISRESTMVLENNQFKNMVIAIHESVAEDKSLISNLKDKMAKASAYLFTATKQRAYFREITILLPSTWSNDPSYGVPTNESLQYADVIITNPTKSKRSLPQARSYSGCGKQGVHVLLTKEFLTDESVDPYSNNSAKYLVHAFAQFRWGVFQEYAESGEVPFYFSIKEGRADAIKCTLYIRGLFVRTDTANFTICYPQYSIDPNTNLYIPQCEWRPYPNRGQRATASIMDHQYIETFRWGVFQEYAESGEVQFYFSIKEGRADAIKCTLGMRGLFVRKDTVNFTICYPSNSIDPSTNLYFEHCEWKPYPVRQRITASIMDHQYISVIRTFCDDISDPRTGHNYEAPSKHNRLCGHRSTWDIISNTPDFSNNKNPPVSNIGQSQLTPSFKVIQAKSRKRRAIVAIETPHLANGVDTTTKTHIKRILHENRNDDDIVILNYSGTTDLVHRLHKHAAHHLNSRIVLIPSSQHDVLSATQAINEVMDGDQDVHVIEMRDNHGIDWPIGVSGYHGSHHPGTSVYDHMSSILNEMASEHDRDITILRDDVQLTDQRNQEEGTFYLDPSLTTYTVVTFHINGGNQGSAAEETLPDITLELPTGEMIGMDSEHCYVDESLGIIQYQFQKAKVGRWKYTIRTKSGSNNISVIVKAKHTPIIEEDPISVRQKVEINLEDHNTALFCDVTRGIHPVIGLNVTATIAKHGGQSETLQLWDNGAGADISKDDGVYSRHIVKLEKGIYHVSFKVMGENGNVWTKEENLDINDAHGPENRISRTLTKRQVDGVVQRHVYGGSFRLHLDLHATEDNIAPSRITDLKVLKILRYRNSIALTWTAPGDDLDTGKVSRYELVVGRNIKDVREILAFASTGTNHSIITTEIVPAIKEAGESETFLWDMGDISPGTSFAFAIRAVDNAGNWATISNVATAGV